MKLAGLHWNQHIAYLATLAGLLFFGVHRLKQLDLIQQDLDHLQSLATVKIQRNTSDANYRIKHDAAPTTKNKVIAQQIIFVGSQVDSFSGKCEKYGAQISKEDQALPKDWAAILGKDYFRILKSFASPQADSTSVVPTAQNLEWTPEWLMTILLQADSGAARQIMNNLRFNLKIVLQKNLLDAYKMLDRLPQLRSDQSLPAFSLDYPRNNRKSLEADVYLLYYSDRQERWPTTVKVNNQMIAMENGIARYETVFHHPGKYKIPIAITVTNPLTKEPLTYTKEFIVPVTPQ